MPSIHLLEDQRRALYMLARQQGWHDIARAIARECPYERGLIDAPCHCHPHPRADLRLAA